MKNWPKLPKTVYGTGGEITVREMPVVKTEKGEDAWGTWEPATRTIEIDEKATPRFKWCTLFHEMMHATLSDSGLVNLLTDDAGEALCEAVGTARLMEMAGRLR